MDSTIKFFRPSGILDGVAANKLRREILEALDKKVDIFVIELQDVTFMNSSGLGTLVLTLRLIKSAGKELFICSPSEQVKMILDLTKVNRVFRTFATREELEQKVLQRRFTRTI